jgi:hypothetical protein
MKQEPKEQPAGGEASAKPEGKVIWSRPHPNSLYQLAAEGMDRAYDKILAEAFRKLAKAEANGLDWLTTADVVEWLEKVKGDIDWLIHHIEHHLDLQADIERLVSEQRRKQCEECDKWFVPERSTKRFCSNRCRQSAYRVTVKSKRA